MGTMKLPPLEITTLDSHTSWAGRASEQPRRRTQRLGQAKGPTKKKNTFHTIAYIAYNTHWHAPASPPLSCWPCSFLYDGWPQLGDRKHMLLRAGSCPSSNKMVSLANKRYPGR